MTRRRQQSVSQNKHRLIIVSSPRARMDPSSALLRLLRDYFVVFRRYEIHTTANTGRTILGTGLYQKEDVILNLPGDFGGIAKLAAMIARKECVACILLLDPGDPWSDTVENRALKRMCIQRKIRLITTYASAVRWSTFEGKLGPDLQAQPYGWKPANWLDGNKKTELSELFPSERTVALVSHDTQKYNMITFVRQNIKKVALHQRILTTGTTGWLLKLLFADEAQTRRYDKEIGGSEVENRLYDVCMAIPKDNLGKNVEKIRTLTEGLSVLRQHEGIIASTRFSGKVMPLPSGPNGGDVLIANEVLENQCHTIIFFHDPSTAHPHNDDIRLLERSCQLPGIFAECVSDMESATRWVKGLDKEIDKNPDVINYAQQLRHHWNLDEAIIVHQEGDEEVDELGRALSRVTAGYFNQMLLNILQRKKQARIGLAWGQSIKWVLDRIIDSHKSVSTSKPEFSRDDLVWSPLVGIIATEITDWEAGNIAEAFRDFYGGRVEGLATAGIMHKDSKLGAEVVQVLQNLVDSDIVLTSASPWSHDYSFHKHSGLNPHLLPPTTNSPAVGVMCGVFLDSDGNEVHGDYKVVGLGYEGLKTAAKNGSVILMCGGNQRRKVVLAALKANPSLY